MRGPLFFLALSALVGCSATGERTQFTGSSSASTGAGAGAGGSTGSTGTMGNGGSVAFDAGKPTDAGTSGPAEVFGQTAGTLYKLDPNTQVVTEVGNFKGCEGDVIDIALDKSGDMFGTTSGSVYKIDKTTAVCTHLADGAFPNSLSFVPAGTLDPNVEALVGYDTDNNYIRIDTTTGAISVIGAGILGDYASSGDIVSVIGGGTYLTVTGGSAPPYCADCIVELDPKTGAIQKNIGALKHGAVFGLAYWGGSAYGFDANGEVFQIDLPSATTTLIQVPNGSGLIWYGAGSTTSAPLIPTQ
jgi:hypothetical protein